MSEEATVIAPSPTAQAASEGYAAFQKHKEDVKAGTVPESKEEDPKPEPGEEEPAKKTGPKEPRQDKGAEAVIAKKHALYETEKARAETEKQRADRLQKEFDDFKAAQTKPLEPKQPEKITPPEEEDPKPTLKEFIKANPEMPYEEAVDGFNDARDEWRDRQEAKKKQASEKQSGEQQLVARANAAVDAARVKYPKFDELTADLGKQVPPVMTQFFIENIEAEKDQANATDILYYLGEHRDEFNRIRALPPTRQVVELGKIQDKLSKPAKKQDAKPELVSRVAPPPVVLKGESEVDTESTSEVKDYKDYQRVKRARTG